MAIPPVSREGGRTGLSKKGKWSPRGTRTTVLTYPCATASRVSVAVRRRARVTGKAGENGQNSGAGRQLTLDNTVGSRVWRHTQGSSGRPASDLGWGSSSKTAPGSLSTGSPAGRTPPHGDGSMYSQANVREESVLRPPNPSVAVRDRGH